MPYCLVLKRRLIHESRSLWFKQKQYCDQGQHGLELITKIPGVPPALGIWKHCPRSIKKKRYAISIDAFHPHLLSYRKIRDMLAQTP